MTRSIATAIPFLFVAASAGGLFLEPESVPVERLIRNTEAFLAEHPDDARAYYTLGRVHYMAYVMHSDTIRAHPPDRRNDRPLPQVATDEMQDWEYTEGQDDEDFVRMVDERFAADDIDDVGIEKILELETEMLAARNRTRRPANPNLDERQRREHMARAVGRLREALELDPGKALYHLTLASALEVCLDNPDVLASVPVEGEQEAKAADPPDGGAQRVARLREEAITGYLDAYRLARKADIDEEFIFEAEDLVSVEAGRHYIALVARRGPTEEEAERIERIKTHLAEIEQVPNAVTPLIFSPVPVAGIDDLLDPGAAARFDLDGDGRAERRGWVRPHTAILVWDPHALGRITSGRQLFGSVTWWLFWPDGYHALDALDDDRDGRLAGEEMRGLAAWFDRNGNAASDPGEVVGLESLGVTAIATRATGRDGAHPMNRAGLHLDDGAILPTWDWVAAERR